MSCNQNDRIREAVLDKCNELDLDEAVFAEADLEACYDFLMKGAIPMARQQLMLDI